MKRLVKMLLHCPDVLPMTLLGPTSCLSEIHALCGKTHNEHGLHQVPDIFSAANFNVELYRNSFGIKWDAEGKPFNEVKCVIEIGDANVADPSDYSYVHINERTTVENKHLLRYVNHGSNTSRIPGIGFFSPYYCYLGTSIG